VSFALLFSGQGAQHASMLAWLPKTLPAALHAQLGQDWRIRLNDPAWAGRNALAQPLLTGLALTAWSLLNVELDAPAAVAGYSVGEVAAFSAAGMYDSTTALDLARQRAACMDHAAALSATGMLGVTGLTPDNTFRLCRDFGLVVAIRNGIDSVVLGGTQASIPPAIETAKLLGARCTPLNVALASHTHWMEAASAPFSEALGRVEFKRPRCPLFSNADGRIASPEQARTAMVRQLTHTVRWDECMEGIASRQVACVLEIGPGQALARMWNQRYPHISARSVDEFRSLRSIVDWVSRQSS